MGKLEINISMLSEANDITEKLLRNYFEGDYSSAYNAFYSYQCESRNRHPSTVSSVVRKFVELDDVKEAVENHYKEAQSKEDYYGPMRQQLREAYASFKNGKWDDSMAYKIKAYGEAYITGETQTYFVDENGKSYLMDSCGYYYINDSNLIMLSDDVLETVAKKLDVSKEEANAIILSMACEGGPDDPEYAAGCTSVFLNRLHCQEFIDQYGEDAYNQLIAVNSDGMYEFSAYHNGINNDFYQTRDPGYGQTIDSVINTIITGETTNDYLFFGAGGGTAFSNTFESGNYTRVSNSTVDESVTQLIYSTPTTSYSANTNTQTVTPNLDTSVYTPTNDTSVYTTPEVTPQENIDYSNNWIYEVKEGDNLTDLANKYGYSSWQEIYNINVQTNPDFNPNVIDIGQKIIMPAKSSDNNTTPGLG